jgi:hypothetical protein
MSSLQLSSFTSLNIFTIFWCDSEGWRAQGGMTILANDCTFLQKFLIRGAPAGKNELL